MGLNPNTAAVGLPGPETFLSRPQYWVKAKKKKGSKMERREAGSNQAKAVLQRYLRCVLRLLEDRGPEWCQHWG